MINFKFINSRLINQTKSIYLKCNSPQMTLVRHYTIRRAILHTPGENRRKIDKALSIKVDCIAFSLEKTADNEGKAQDVVHDLLNEGNVRVSDPEWCVKMNPIQTGNLFLSDMEAALTAKKLPPAIILSDIDRLDLLRWFTEQLWKRLLARPEHDRGPIKLLISTGSARELLMLKEICERVEDLATMAPIIPSAIIFDNINYLDSIGGTRTAHGIEFLYARQKIVLVAKAFGLQAIDIPNSNPMAIEELQNECREGACMGYTGKLVLYPNHVPVVEKEFIPTRSKVARAKMMVRKLSERENIDMDDFTPDRIPTEDPKMKMAKYVVQVATSTCKIREDR